MNQWSRLRLSLGLLFAVVALTGCPPSFEDDVCQSDADCFAGEVCNTTTNSCRLAVVQVEPEIVSFTATPATAPPNSEVTLEWTTNQALNGSISDANGVVYSTSGAELASGSFTFTIGIEPRELTFTATNGANSTTETLTVQIDPPDLAITRFEATPNPVEPSALLTLEWATENAESARIITGGADYMVPVTDLAGGQWQTTTPVTTTYTLEITSIVGETLTQDLNVVVEGGEPAINSFEVSQNEIIAGDSIDLSWDTLGADSIIIVDDTGAEVDLTGEAPTGGSVTLSPTMNVEYTLTASNDIGDTIATVSVVVEGILSIDDFSAGSTQITEGDSVMLGWTVSGDSPILALTETGGAAVDISSQSVNSGAVAVSPAQTTTYTLAASTNLQSDSATVTVTVLPPAPVINSFVANPAEVVSGGSSTLSWDITGATSIAISNDLGSTIPTAGKAVTIDSLAVNLSTTRTFTIRATNAGGFDEASVTIIAGSAVGITSFAASPVSISPGQSVTLSWTTANASMLDLESDQGDIIDLTGKSLTSDSVTVSPTATTTYSLTADGLAGPVTQDVTVTVQPAVAITSFTATPATVVAGNAVTLTWATTDATSIQITYLDAMGTNQLVNTVGKSVSGDSVMITPTGTTTYTLTADGFQGPATTTASVTVQQPVSITSFSTDRTVVAAGEEATLTWAVANATSVTITDSGGASVDLTGATTAGDSVSVTPGADETYTLTANGPAGPVTQDVLLEVVDPTGITISEILADPTNANDQRQWIEVANTGSTILDLSKFSVGAGSAAYNEALIQLSGTLAPGGCVVVGGPTSDADNGLPTFDVSGDFSPDLPTNGGVALFVGPVAEQSATRSPVASVVWGGANPNGLLETDGTPKSVVAPALVEGSSLSRTSTSDALTNAAPTPGQCFHIEAVSPSVGSNQASGTVSIDGFGFDVLLDSFAIGADTLTACTETPAGVDCTLPSSSQSGSADLTVSRVNEVVSDGSGGTMIVARGASIDGVFSGAYFYENEIPDPGLNYYCGISAVSPSATVALGTNVTVTLEVFLQGETDVNGVLPAGYIVEALEFAGGVLPATIFDAGWSAATAGSAIGNNASFTTVLSNSTPTTSELAFRVSPDSGESWYYCDTNASSGSDDGYQVGGGQVVTWQ